MQHASKDRQPGKKTKGFHQFFKSLFKSASSSSSNNSVDDAARGLALKPSPSITSTTITASLPKHPTGEECLKNAHHDQTLSSPGKTHLAAAWSFIQVLIKKMPDVVDGNPVKSAFGLAKMIIEIREGVKDTLDILDQNICSIMEQFMALEIAFKDWNPSSDDETQALHKFEGSLNEELKKLVGIKSQPMLKNVALYEDNRKEIDFVFARINQARECFMLSTSVSTLKVAISVQRDLNSVRSAVLKTLLRDLKPSEVASHKYHLEGEERRLLRRSSCTPGTRGRILAELAEWATNTTPQSESIYWLFGPAGSGKSTIAFTVAERLDSIGILAADFFCSRQFQSTRSAKRIIPTLAYNLAAQSEAFGEALSRSKLDSAHHGAHSQLDNLLIRPWLEARATEPPAHPNYIMVIDALDEIEDNGGSDFLRELLDAINKQQLPGLKFFVTSRRNPDLVRHVESFKDRRYYRLEEVPLQEVQADIEAYLNAHLPYLVGGDLMGKLVLSAGGLFISAATLVKYAEGYQKSEQKKLLRKLISANPSTTRTAQPGTLLLDQLYTQILSDAIGGFEGDFFTHRLHLLHTFLCTAERTPPSIPAALMPPTDVDSEDDASISADPPTAHFTEVANDVLQRLYAVLYSENGHVLTYHKSFPDFVFDKARSGRYWCNQQVHHQQLAESSFRIMEAGLRFNIANIQTSYLFDRDNHTLQSAIDHGIPQHLRYACKHWGYHLTSSLITRGIQDLFNTISGFLELRVLFWIEAMSLLGHSGECDRMLRDARNFIAKDNLPLATRLVETSNFALYFSSSPASLSTPHLYLSALATWPRTFEPYPSWRRHFPRIPRFTSRLDRGAQLATFKFDKPVVSVGISPDGRYIGCGCTWGDGWLRILDASSGEVEHALAIDCAIISSVAFSSDGSLVLSGSSDNVARAWDMRTGKLVKEFPQSDLHGGSSYMASVSVSPDGVFVASGCADGVIALWEIATGKMVHELRTGTRYWVRSVAFSYDGSRLVSSGWDGFVRMWNPSTGRVVAEFRTDTQNVNDAQISPDGTWVFAVASHSIYRWSTAVGANPDVARWEGHSGTILSLAVSGDGKRLASASEDQTIRIWNTSTGETFRVFEGHTGTVQSIAFSWDGARIVSCGDCSVHVWDVSGTGPEGVNGTRVDDINGLVGALSVSQDGSQVVLGSGDGLVRVCDAASGVVLKVLEGHTDFVTSVAFLGGTEYVVSGARDATVRIWHALTAQIRHVLGGHEIDVLCVASSDTASDVASGSSDGSVRIWDTVSGAARHTLLGHESRVRSVVFLADGAQLVSGSLDGSIRVWDVASGASLAVLPDHSERIFGVNVSRDGRYIAAGLADYTTWVWDATNRTKVSVLRGHSQFLSCVAFSSDGSRVVSGSTDATVRVWDTSTGEQLHVLEGHTHPVSYVAFSQTNIDQVMSGSADKTMRVWDISTNSSQRETVGYIPEKQTDFAGTERLTGWLLSPNREGYLMFIPLDDMIPDLQNVRTVPPFRCSSVDFTNASVGTEWCSCFDA